MRAVTIAIALASAFSLTGCENGKFVGFSASKEQGDSASSKTSTELAQSSSVGRDLSTTITQPAAPKIIRALRTEVGKTNSTPHAQAIEAVLSCAKPRQGWPSELARDAELFLLSFNGGKPPRKLDDWIRDRMVDCDIADSVMSKIAFDLGAQILKDDEEASIRIVELFYGIPGEQIASWRRKAQSSHSSSTERWEVVDNTLHWVTDQGSEYKADAKGMLVSRDQALWHGDGRMSGKLVELKLAKNKAVKVDNSVRATDDVGVDVSNKSSANVSSQ